MRNKRLLPGSSMDCKRRLAIARYVGNRPEYRGSPHEVKIEVAMNNSFFFGFPFWIVMLS